MKKRFLFLFICTAICIGGKSQTSSANNHQDDFSNWYAGVEYSIPFLSGDMSSFADDKTYIGSQFGLRGGYQFNRLFGLELSFSYARSKVGSKSYSLDYIIGPDAMTYYPPTTLEGTKYSDAYSRVTYFQFGLHPSINLNNIFVKPNESHRFTFLFQPGIYLQKFSPTLFNKNTGDKLDVRNLDNSFNLGLGADFAVRFKASRDIDLQIRSGMIWINNNDFDGISTEARAKDSYMWTSGISVFWKFNGNNYKDNKLYQNY